MVGRRKGPRREKAEKEENKVERKDSKDLLISRRKFLKAAAGGAASLIAAGRLDMLRVVEASSIPPPPVTFSGSSFSATVVRPDDFLAFRFEFINLKLQSAVTASSTTPSSVLVPIRTPAYIILNLPPQNIAEQAFYETAGSNLNPNNARLATDINGISAGSPVSDLGANISEAPSFEDSSTLGGETPSPPGIVLSRLSGWSRLVFIVPSTVTSIPYTLSDLLQAISTYDLNVTGTALPPLASYATIDPSIPGIAQPLATQTAIEAPYRLIVSPNNLARWNHSPTPVAHGGRIELWHSRLAVKSNIDQPAPVRPDEVTTENRTIRAVWSPDFEADQFGLPTTVPTNPNSTGDKITHYTAAQVNDNGPPGFRTSLDNRDRDEIVHLTSNFHIQPVSILPQPPYNPLAVPVNRLMLSSLGAWVDVDQRWDPPFPLSVSEWRHLATIARDHYVKVVYAGWLGFPGNRASLVKVTERKFLLANTSPYGLIPTYSVVAYLRQRMYIVVREPEKIYPAPGQPWNGRNTPFKKLRITTLVTPSLDDPSNSQVDSHGQDAFWPQVNGKDFLFHFIATDWDGKTSEFSAPLLFVDNSLNSYDLTSILTNTAPTNGYLNPGSLARRTVQMNGQKIAFAPSLDSVNQQITGKSSYETSSIVFAIEMFDQNKIPFSGGTSEKSLPIFYPALDSAQVRIAAVEELAGGNPTIPSITYYGGLKNNLPFGYLGSGFNSTDNRGEVFAEIMGGVGVDLSKSVEKLGGVLTPSLNYVGLARQAGPIPGDTGNIDQSLSDLANGTHFDPTAALLAGAKILGGIPLNKILPPVSLNPQDTVGDGIKVPKIVAAIAYDNGKENGVLITLHWEPVLQSWDPISLPNGAPPGPPNNSPLFYVQNGPPYMNQGTLQSTAPIVIDAQLRKSLDPNQRPTYNVTGIINGPIFLNLLPGGSSNPFQVISIPFNKLQFSLQTGGKTNVSADLGGIGFLGILKFIQELASIIPGSGFDDPPFIDVNASGITTGFNIGIPTIPVGAIIVSNIKLESSLNIPFIGDPARLRFAISEREHPFTITYTIFGGGGFFGIAMGLDGIELIEGALEFGAYLSLDLGVASGSAHAAVGLYFKYEQDPGPPVKDTTELSGYCRIGGQLEVLGLVAVSTEFYMELDYFPSDNACEGQASLTVEVDVAFFHQSVTIGPIEKKFSHSPPLSSLAFGNLVPQEGWNEYVLAFA